MSYDGRDDENEYNYSSSQKEQENHEMPEETVENISEDIVTETVEEKKEDTTQETLGETSETTENSYYNDNASNNAYAENTYQTDPRFAERKKTSGKGIAGLILGIVTIVLCCIPFVSVITGIIGLILAIVCLSKKEAKGLGIAGVITSAIGLVLSVIMIFVWVFGFAQGFEQAIQDGDYSSLEDSLAGSSDSEDSYSEGSTDDYDVDDYGEGDDTGYYDGEIGDTMQTYFFDFSVNSVQYVDSYAGVTPDAGYRFVDAVISIQNTSEDSLPMWNQDFQVQWGDGDDDYGYGTIINDSSVMPEEYEIEAGGTATYHVIYQVPTDSTGEYSISYQEYFSDDTTGDLYFVYFDLGE